MDLFEIAGVVAEMHPVPPKPEPQGFVFDADALEYLVTAPVSELAAFYFDAVEYDG